MVELPRPTIHADITMRGLNQVTSRMSESALFEVVYDGLRDCLIELRDLVQRMTPVDTGHTADGIYYEMNGTSIHDLNGIVASPDEHFIVLDLGRTPGRRMPPEPPLTAWGSRHGIFGKGAIFMLRKRIAQRGLPAHHIMARALEQGRQHFPGLFIKRWIEYESRW